VRFAWNNLLENSEYTLSAADQYSSIYEIDNIIDRRLAKIYRSGLITNLMTYGDCEETTSPTLDGGTTGLANATWARNSAEYNEGSYSWLFTKTSAAAGGDAENWLTDNVDTDDMHGLIAGRTYQLRLDLFTDVAALANAQIIIQEYYTAAWHDVLTLEATQASIWQTKRGSFTINSATTAITLKLFIDTSEDAGVLLYLDDIRIYLEKRILLDVGSGNTINPTIISILNHNLSDTAQIKLQGNSADNWTSPTVNESLTYDEDIILKFITASGLRYWSILFDDPDNEDGYIEIGYSFLGNYLQATKGPARVFSEKSNDNSTFMEGPCGQGLGTLEVELHEWELNVPWWTDAMKKSFKSMYNNIKKVRPFIFILDENNLTNFGPKYVRIAEYEFTHIMGLEYWALKMRVKEMN